MSNIEIYGKPIDDSTRCEHYHSEVDIIAIKFKCCGKYYPCYECHAETAGHAAEIWSKNDWDVKAILCGVCKTELSIGDYMQSGNRCPNCNAAFNPNCSKHYHLYFQA